MLAKLLRKKTPVDYFQPQRQHNPLSHFYTNLHQRY
jgi:hypothetical protein